MNESLKNSVRKSDDLDLDKTNQDTESTSASFTGNPCLEAEGQDGDQDLLGVPNGHSANSQDPCEDSDSEDKPANTPAINSEDNLTNTQDLSESTNSLLRYQSPYCQNGIPGGSTKPRGSSSAGGRGKSSAMLQPEEIPVYRNSVTGVTYHVGGTTTNQLIESNNIQNTCS